MVTDAAALPARRGAAPTGESIDGVGVSLRRGGLVAALSVASDVPDAQSKLVALAERLLERAGSLGS